MVKVGFICEGKTEKAIIQSDAFQAWLHQNRIECVFEVIDAKGGGNLLPHNIGLITKELALRGAQQIVILTDSDDDLCVTLTRERINALPNQHVVVAVRQIEAWFLSDTETLKGMLNDTGYYCREPEKIPAPFEYLKNLFLLKTGRGVGGKAILVSRMLKYGFTPERAAEHPNCPSARYFLTKLQRLASTAG
ncbi:hypothetical protein [Arsenicibacter rosenii]|uniref:DUF4276 family protein n=1 Tax=Arsenicibacter rosenii TaxID=1750698 RepID=A0A1S2VS22_9BACT|nr:hypothetical protein [Arsenicibacter rosenii]OIN61115.1 hypothetical protein BLX24_03360 [Arsenicibacter rosenii]